MKPTDPAFPGHVNSVNDGMPIRLWLAAMAMQGQIAFGGIPSHEDDLREDGYNALAQADALLAAYNEDPPDAH